MFRKFTLTLAALLLAIALLAGCSASKNYAGGVAMDSAPGEGMDSAGIPEKGDLNLESTADSGRKLIRTVSVNAQTKEYDTFLSSVKKNVLAAGGYIEQSTENSSPTRTYRSASLTLRIPAGETDGLLDLIGSLGTVTRREEGIRDVTLDYVDTESHLKALRAEEESLLTLLAEATSVVDIISIRDRLTEVRYEIEAYESALRTFDNQVDYATVSLYVSEVEREIPVNESVWSEIGGNLSEAMVNISTFFRNTFVFLVSALPYLLVFAGIPGGIVFLCIWIPVRRHKKKRALKEAEKIQ